MKIDDQQQEMFFKWMDDNYDAFQHQIYSKRGRDSTQSAELFSQASLVPAVNMKRYIHELVTLDRAATLKGFPRPVLYIGSERGWPAGKSWSALASERALDGLGTPDTLRVGASAGLIAKDQADSLATAIAAFAGKVLGKK
jgi:hypothetical protein